MIGPMNNRLPFTIIPLLVFLVFFQPGNIRAQSGSTDLLNVSRQQDGAVRIEWDVPAGPDPETDYGVELRTRQALDAGVWSPVSGPGTAGSFGLTGEWVIESPESAAFFSVRRIALPVIGGFRGKIVSTELIGSYGAEEILQRLSDYTDGLTESFPVPIENDVEAHRVVYLTPDISGSLIEASGVVFIPVGVETPLATVSYQHGTLFNKEDAPSLGNTDEYTVGLFLAGSSYVCVMADYLGFGSSAQLLHPYLHAATEASSCLDMLVAARAFQQNTGVPIPDKLFLTGYSQGGHSTMVLHREIEMNHSDQFTVTASAPMAGPHSMSEVMLDRIFSSQPYPNPFYVAFLIFSYNEVYGLFDDPSEYFVAPYATLLPQLFESNAPESQINALLPASASQYLKLDVLNAIRNDENHPVRQALRDNDSYTGDWVPAAPIRMFHCRADEVVPYENSEKAQTALSAAGATGVRAEDPRIIPFLQDGSHVGCVPWALIALQGWVEDFF